MSFNCPKDGSRLRVTETRNTTRCVRRKYQCCECDHKEVSLEVLMVSHGPGKPITGGPNYRDPKLVAKTAATIHAHWSEITKHLSRLAG